MEMDANIAQWLVAIRTRSYVTARQLLLGDQDVNVRGAGGTTALHAVASCHDAMLKKIEKLLLDGADPHLTDDYGRTPLRVAQRHNKVIVVQSLVGHDALLRALTGRLGREPGHDEVVTAMQSKNMRQFREDVRLQVEVKSLELITVARQGELLTVRRIIESEEITIDAVDVATGETAFSAALVAGRRRVCEYLLENNAHLYAPCIVGGRLQSVLTTAVSGGDVEFVRRLVALGARLTVADVAGMDTHTSPLAEAVKSGSIEMVDALLDLGARSTHLRHGLSLSWPANEAFTFDLSIAGNVTPWWLLAMACWHQDRHLVEHLFKTQAVLSDRSKLAKHGAQALFLAILQEDDGIINDLLDRGVSINEAIDKDLTTVIAAVAVNSTKLLQFLLARGADATVVHTSINSNREGLLATAVYAGAMDCARILLPMETRPLHLDQALYAAAKRSNVEFTQLLLDTALPSTRQALRTTVTFTRCPLLLDLLLSRCCVDGGPYCIADVDGFFGYACRHSVDIVSVFLAHGVDINHRSESEVLPPFKSALLENVSSGLEVAKALLDNGIEVVSFASPSAVVPLLQLVEAKLNRATTASEREYFEAGRDLLITHGVFHVV